MKLAHVEVEAMKFFDRAFGATTLAFAAGSLAGAVTTSSLLAFREGMAFLLSTRAIVPVRAVSSFGELALVLLVFTNNSVPVLLSFLFPFIVAKVRWNPPLRGSVRNQLLTVFSLLTGGLIGFFNLGATLMLVFRVGGATMLNGLIASSWLHAPLEFLFVLMSVAESVRIVMNRVREDEVVEFLRGDLKVLFMSLVGLLASAVIEVFAGL